MRRRLERFLAISGAGICVWVAVFFALSQASPGTSPWPLPGLVLLETGLLGIIGVLAVASGERPDDVGWSYATWAVAGAISALVVLGAWTIGLFLLPAALAFLAAGLLARRRHALPLPRLMLVWGLSAALQAAGLMLPFLLTAS